MVETHTPLLHDVPTAHTFPQNPQLLLSVAVFTHVPPQNVLPLGHVRAIVVDLDSPVHGILNPPAATEPQTPQVAVADVPLEGAVQSK